jgi:ATP-binding cassette subfamily B protein
MKRYRVLDGTALKLIAMLSMVFDHVGDAFFPGVMWLRMVGRIAMPVFAFCIAEGYAHTRDRKKYLLRMGLFALVSEIPFDLCFHGKPGFGHQNIMLTFFLSILALFIVIVSGSSAVLGGTISLGTLFIFVEYIQSFFQPIQELAEQFSTLQNAIASAEKIFTLLDEKPLITDPENPVRPSEIRGRIEFDHVWFAYQNEDWVLRDVSFVIEPGQNVAFVGATGAGKSSILNLIGRYYDIQKGSIRIDGTDIRDMSREQIRASIGQVQQDVFIFTGDILSNIRLLNTDITDAQAEEAAREVNAARFIERLPLRYHQAVTERGATFSAGQRQLLSFARTLAFDPTILILDEATANIDTETEQWIQEAVETLMKGRTTIMVAHRLSTIQHADRIIVMHHGKIRETGTHQELLEHNGIYKKLYQLQLA